MLKAFRISLLLLTLSCSVYAGEIPNGVTGTTSTTQGVMQNGRDGDIQNGDDGDMQNGAPGEIPNGGAGASSQTSIDGLEVTFNLMQSLLGLF